jgi:hypothetical protein
VRAERHYKNIVKRFEGSVLHEELAELLAVAPDPKHSQGDGRSVFSKISLGDTRKSNSS